MLTNSRSNHTPPFSVACQHAIEKLVLLQKNTFTPYLITVNASECFDSQFFVSMFFCFNSCWRIFSHISKRQHGSVRKVEKLHFREPIQFQQLKQILGEHQIFLEIRINFLLGCALSRSRFDPQKLPIFPKLNTNICKKNRVKIIN